MDLCWMVTMLDTVVGGGVASGCRGRGSILTSSTWSNSLIFDLAFTLLSVICKFWCAGTGKRFSNWKKLFSSAECRIRRWDVWDTKSPADWMPTHKPTELSRIKQKLTLRWRHNGCDGISNHQPHDCLLNRLFRRRSKKTSKFRVTGLCTENSPGTGEFSAQMASNAENVSISWSHHELNSPSLWWDKFGLPDEGGELTIFESFTPPPNAWRTSAENRRVFPLHCKVVNKIQ